MKRKHLVIIGFVAIAGLMLTAGYVGRNFINDARVTKVAQDELSETIDQMMLEANGVQIQGGNFVDGDAFHDGEGGVGVFTTDGAPLLAFENDFRVTNGPDLVVYLSENSVASGEGLGEFVSLGDLKSSSGAQVYTLPANYTDYNSVVIWCRAFGVLFSSADLNSVN